MLGVGVPQDDAEGVRWYRLAAEQGDAQAQYMLGDMYRFGRGVSQDDISATRWYRSAADQGDAISQFNLGIMYSNGQGVPQDDVEAHIWLALAAVHSFAEDHEQYAKARDAVAAA